MPKHQSSVRSAKSFPTTNTFDRGNESSASDDDMYGGAPAIRRAPSVSSQRSKRSASSKRKSGVKGAAVGGAAAVGAGTVIQRSSSRNGSYRQPPSSDEERQSLRTGSVKSASIFDEARSDPDTDEEERQARHRVNNEPIDLTAVDRHYLNKALICLQMQREWSALSQIGALALYGTPFLNHPTGPKSKPEAPAKASGGLFASLPIIGGGKKLEAATPAAQQNGYQESTWDKPTDPPILRYLFYRFIKNFPGLDEAKEEYWTDRIQPFFDSFAERNFSVTRERGEVTKRRLLAMGFTRVLGTYMGSAITPLGDSTPSRPDKALMTRVDLLFPGNMQAMHRILCGKRKDGSSKAPNYNAWVGIPAGGSTEEDKVRCLALIYTIGTS